ncbi:MAG: DUF6567 family protein [Verrucomicrobiota bacterium]|jgi:hypothetical protein
MKRKNLALVLCSISLAILTGCSTEGEFRQSTGTSVSLAGNNYKLIKEGVRGTSSGFRLLGFIPIVSPTHAGAKASLYQSVGQPLTGRSVALANETEDRSSLYLILFSIPKITVTADLVEFTDASGGGGNTSK